MKYQEATKFLRDVYHSSVEICAMIDGMQQREDVNGIKCQLLIVRDYIDRMVNEL